MTTACAEKKNRNYGATEALLVDWGDRVSGVAIFIGSMGLWPSEVGRVSVVP